MKWDGTVELGYLDECERQSYFIPSPVKYLELRGGTPRTHEADRRL